MADGLQRGSSDGSLTAWTITRFLLAPASIDAMLAVVGSGNRMDTWRVSRRDEIQVGSESSSNCDETTLACGQGLCVPATPEALFRPSPGTFIGRSKL